jgi:hypothetical protein
MDRLYGLIQRDGLNGLTDAEIGFFGIYWFVMETNNGGLHQFFFNDSGQLALPALAYLERVGATGRRSNGDILNPRGVLDNLGRPLIDRHGLISSRFRPARLP